MNTKVFFPFGEGSNLIFAIGRENQKFFLRTLASVIFSLNSGISPQPFILQEKTKLFLVDI